MKYCNCCKKDLDEINFRKRSSTKDGLQKWCKSCQVIYDKKYYQDNKTKRLKYNRKISIRNHLFITSYKLKLGCSICGYNKCSYALEFHHTDDNKEADVSASGSNCSSIKTIQKEIDKCIVVCANCHREIHYINLRS